MTLRIYRILAALVLVAGCQSTVVSGGTDAGTPTGSGKGSKDVQSGPVIAYTPDGCNYTVTTPTVDKAETGGTVAATMPPDHVHAAFAGDPSTSFAVNWRSEMAANLTTLYYGIDQAKVSDAMAAGSGVQVAYGHAMLYTSALDAGQDPTRVHEVHVCGLQPATKYFYKVGNPGAFSKVFSLTTAPALGSSASVRFAIAGDARDHADVWSKAESAIQAAGAQFQLFSGDAVELGGTQLPWNNFFETPYNGVPASDVMADIPIMLTNGNHDMLSVNYLAQFALPQVAPPAGSAKVDGKQWYSFNYGSMHLVALDDSTASSDTIAGEEKTWLASDLAAVDRTKTPWIFVVHHKPTYSCSPTHGSDLSIRAAWQPVYDQYKVDAVFNGHVHNYERSKPIRGFQQGSSEGLIASSYQDGTMYVVAAGVGADLYGIGTDCPHTAQTEQSITYLILDVTSTKMVMTTYRLDQGNVLETVELDKG